MPALLPDSCLAGHLSIHARHRKRLAAISCSHSPGIEWVCEMALTLFTVEQTYRLVVFLRLIEDTTGYSCLCNRILNALMNKRQNSHAG